MNQEIQAALQENISNVILETNTPSQNQEAIRHVLVEYLKEKNFEETRSARNLPAESDLIYWNGKIPEGSGALVIPDGYIPIPNNGIDWHYDTM